MKVKSESEFAQLCPTLSDPMDCSLPGSSVHGIFQARVLEWVAIAFSDRAPTQPYNRKDEQGRVCPLKRFIVHLIITITPKASLRTCSVVSDSLQPHGL